MSKTERKRTEAPASIIELRIETRGGHAIGNRADIMVNRDSERVNSTGCCAATLENVGRRAYTAIRATDWWQETKFPDWHQTHNLSAIQLTAILRLALSSWFSARNHISTSFATNVLCSPFYKIRDLTYGSHIEGLQEAYYNQYTKYMFIAYKCC